jgi:serine/threonine-protein kinase RsbT
MAGQNTNEVIGIYAPTDIVLARRMARELAESLGFGRADQTRLATAVSELARNVIQYAGGGFCTITQESDDRMIQVVVYVEDTGPGIPDIEMAMRDGFSTSGGLGAGLPGTRRLVDNFSIQSEPGKTRVRIALVRVKH